MGVPSPSFVDYTGGNNAATLARSATGAFIGFTNPAPDTTTQEILFIGDYDATDQMTRDMSQYLFFDGDNLVLNGVTIDNATLENIQSATGNVGASVTVSDTAPASPSIGDLWYYTGGAAMTDTAQLFVWVDTTGDGTGDSWIVTTPAGGGGGGGGGLTVEDLVTGDLTVTGALEAAEAAIQQLFFLDATGSTLQLSQQLQVGDLVIGDDARPTSGSGLLAVGSDGQTGDPDNTTAGTTTGDFAVGATDQYLSWDTSAGTLTIQGSISNLTQARLDGLAGAWHAITDDVSDLTNTDAFQEGAGLYRCVMVGGGGSGAGTVRWATATGGGAGGIALWTLDWDGSTALAFDAGTGGASRTGNGSGSAGGASTFSVGGSIRITTNGGGGGNVSNAAATNGGTGGTAALTSSHSSISDTTFRSGGAGGAAGAMPSDGGVGTGGGGVDFLGNGDTVGGAVNRTGGNRVYGASGGGGPFGAGGTAVIGPGGAENIRIAISAGATANSAAGSASRTTNGTSTGTTGQSLLGPYLGSVPEGTSTYLGVVGNASTSRQLDPTDGMCGGGGTTGNTGSSINDDTIYQAQSGHIFGGGGGCTSADANNGIVRGGTGGIGAGGGGVSGGSRTSGAGGGGALFVLRL